MTATGVPAETAPVPRPATAAERRRSLWLALAAALVAVLWIGVVPLLDRALSYDDPVREGERFLLAPGITFAPPPGWNVKSGLRAGERTRTEAEDLTVEVATGNVRLRAVALPFDGSPAELLSRIGEGEVVYERESLSAIGPRFDLPTGGAGRPGVAEQYTSPSNDGIIGAFLFGDTGVAVNVLGPTAQINDQLDEIVETLTSFTYRPAAVGAGKEEGE